MSGDLDATFPGLVSLSSAEMAALARDKEIAKACTNCLWAVTQKCIRELDGCLSTGTRVCGPENGGPGEDGWVRWKVQFAQAPPSGSGLYEQVGEFCGPGGGGVSIEGVREAFRGLVAGFPGPVVNYQPEWGTLVNLETRFWTPAPDGFRMDGFVDGLGWSLGERTLRVGGQAVTVTPHVRWVWSFGDGVVGTFYVPGAPYPDAGVTHAYTVPAGRDDVVVTAQYTAVYNGADLGVVVEKASPVKGIAVLTAHAELTDPRNP